MESDEPARFCLICGKPLVRPKKMSETNWRSRRTCSVACRSKRVAITRRKRFAMNRNPGIFPEPGFDSPE